MEPKAKDKYHTEITIHDENSNLLYKLKVFSSGRTEGFENIIPKNGFHIINNGIRVEITKLKGEIILLKEKTCPHCGK